MVEFTKRLQRYCDFRVYELKPLVVEEKTDAHRKRVTEKETELVLELMQSRAFLAAHGKNLHWIALDESGKPQPTLAWSELLQRDWDQSRAPVFFIGSGLGLGDELIKRAQVLISFGPQTFSHELARLVLTEQLYRAASLLEGHPYHNEG